jgi:hypothetical protein
MADSADNPHITGSESTPAQPAAPAASPPVRDSLRGFVTSPPVSSEVYQPLSMTVIVGFGMAVLYVLFVAGFSAFTVLAGDHLYLPLWTAWLPVVVAAVCWVGRRAVLHSEGTLGGARLANWGLGMTVVVGLCYWSYHAATYIALRQQAVAFGKQFLTALAKGNEAGVDEAYLLTYNPPRPTKAAARKLIELNLNARSTMKVPGAYTMFTRSEFVRLLNMAGDKAHWNVEGVGAPVLEKGVMQVPILFKVETPLKTFNLRVLADAIPPTKEAPGRQWRVDRDTNSTGITLESSSFNEDGVRLLKTIEPSAQKFLLGWIGSVTDLINVESAYFGTLTPAKRASLVPKTAGKSMEEVTKAAAKDPEVAEFLKDVDSFRAGGLVTAKKETFWVSSEPLREDIITEAKNKFLLRGRAGTNWLSVIVAPTAYKEENGKITLVYDADIFLMPKYVACGKLTIEADAAAAEDGKDPTVWRVVSLELTRAQSAPLSQPGKPQ